MQNFKQERNGFFMCICRYNKVAVSFVVYLYVSVYVAKVVIAEHHLRPFCLFCMYLYTAFYLPPKWSYSGFLYVRNNIADYKRLQSLTANLRTAVYAFCLFQRMQITFFVSVDYRSLKCPHKHPPFIFNRFQYNIKCDVVLCTIQYL